MSVDDYEASGLDFSVSVPTEIVGMTLYGPGGLVAAFRRNEDGDIVEVEPEDAVIGVAIDKDLRTRWLTIRDADG